jgi:hypothetical protein
MEATIIGAIAALAGVALSQLVSIFQTHLAKKRQRAELLTKKLEELSEHLSQAHVWAVDLIESLTKSNHRGSTPKPHQCSALWPSDAQRVHVLALLYFPALQAESLKLLGSSKILYSIATNYVAVSDEQFKNAATDFNRCRETLYDLIAQEAKKLT